MQNVAGSISVPQLSFCENYRNNCIVNRQHSTGRPGAGIFYPIDFFVTDFRFGSLADILQCKKACPLYPQKRTCAVHKPMSALCQ